MRWLAALLLCLVSMSAYAEKWRIGYYEGGPYQNYQETLKADVSGLESNHVLELPPFPHLLPERTDELWKWLARTVRSEHIEFVEDAYYSADWTEENRAAIVEAIKQRDDLDLIIAMGTWAGKDLAAAELDVPIVVHSASDAVGAGIVEGITFSGVPNVHATVHPYRYKRQIEIFYGVVHFRKLGVFYADTEVGRSYSGIEEVRQVAREKGFELVECHTVTDIPDNDPADESVLKCVNELAPQVDALYLTEQQGISTRTINAIVKKAIEHKIATFQQLSDHVPHGVMMSLSKKDRGPVGRFNADAMLQILRGEPATYVPQSFHHPAKIALNVEAALRIGFRPPGSLLGTADEVFYSIEVP